MRDMHRHHRCTQIFQPYTAAEWAVPEGITLPVEFKYAMNRAQVNVNITHQLRAANGSDVETAAYLLPLGMKRRFLMKMNTGEVDYITELRTRPTGHIAYRRVAWEMFKALQRCAPASASSIEDRVVDPDAFGDIYDR